MQILIREESKLITNIMKRGAYEIKYNINNVLHGHSFL